MHEDENFKDDAGQKSSKLRERLMRLRNEVNINKKFLDNSLNEFVEISALLNSFLPTLSDPSLTDIDDLLYEDDDEELNDEQAALANNFFCLYHPVYFYYVLRPGPSKRILDLTYLKFVDVISTSIFKLHVENYKVFAIVVILISSRCTNKVCQGLKLLRVGLDKHKFYMVEHITKKLHLVRHAMAWLSDLSKIPQAKDSKKKMITSWLSLNASVVMEILEKEDFDFKLRSEKLDKLSAQPGGNFIHILLEELWPTIYTSINNPYFSPIARYHDRLLSYFHSATNEDAKRDRLRVLLRGCYIYDQKVRGLGPEPDKTCAYLRSLRQLAELLNDCIEHIIKSLGSANEETKGIENCPWSQFVPYLSNSPNTEPFPAASSGQEVEEGLKELQNSGDNNKNCPNEVDFTVEKYLYFDDFMKCLELLSIFNEAIQNAEELLGTTGGVDGFDAEVLRPNGYAKRYIIDIIHNPSKRGKVPWMIRVMLDKCPFLFCNPRLGDMIKEMMKLMRGENVDEVSEERIYFTLNSTFQIYE